MILVRSVEELQRLPSHVYRGGAVAIGNLDGMHRGHQALIASACESARLHSVPACVLTFSPHPQEVLSGSSTGHRLTTDGEKSELIAQAGATVLFVLPFNSALAELSPEEFYQRYLVQALQASSVHVGEDFRFGSKRAGDTVLLQRCGSKARVHTAVIPAVVEGGARISSTEIRRALREGKVAQAAVLLGRPYSIEGKVVPGQGRGKQLGIPTANLHFSDLKVVPQAGVYATRVRWNGGKIGAVTNLGVRPTFETKSSKPVLETHLLDFKQDLYGQTIEVEFLDWIRAEKRFDGMESLRRQIGADIETARTYC